MTTWTIGPHAGVYFGQWGNEDHTELYIFDSPPTGYGIVNNPLTIADALDQEANNGFFIRPWRKHEFWNWDDVNNEWVNDPIKFPIAFRAAMSAYRKTKSEDIISYNGVHVRNNKDEISIIGSLIEFLKTEGEDVALNWKGVEIEPLLNQEKLPDVLNEYGLPSDNPAYDPMHPDAQPRWAQAKLADFSGVVLVGIRREQWAFNSEKFVMDTNAVTAYPSIESAIIDFDIKFDELSGV